MHPSISSTMIIGFMFPLKQNKICKNVPKMNDIFLQSNGSFVALIKISISPKNLTMYQFVKVCNHKPIIFVNGFPRASEMLINSKFISLECEYSFDFKMSFYKPHYSLN